MCCVRLTFCSFVVFVYLLNLVKLEILRIFIIYFHFYFYLLFCFFSFHFAWILLACTGISGLQFFTANVHIFVVCCCYCFCYYFLVSKSTNFPCPGLLQSPSCCIRHWQATTTIPYHTIHTYVYDFFFVFFFFCLFVKYLTV